MEPSEFLIDELLDQLGHHPWRQRKPVLSRNQREREFIKYKRVVQKMTLPRFGEKYCVESDKYSPMAVFVHGCYRKSQVWEDLKVDPGGIQLRSGILLQ